MLLNAALFGGLAGSATILGILSVLYFEDAAKRYSPLLVALAAGVLLGAAFFRLMPEAEEHFAGAHAVVLIGMLGFYVLENRFLIHMCEEDEECDLHTVGFMAVLGIGFHSLIDGVAIGAGFRVEEALGVLTAVAVIFHEYPEGVIAYGLLLTGTSKRTALLLATGVALATPAGAVLTYLYAPALGESGLGVLLALAAGSFIYVGASDLMPRTHESRGNLEAALVLVGVLISYGLVSMIPHG